MEIKLSTNAITLLRHVLNYTGEKEVDKDGKKEVFSPRRLWGEDQSQRRHFMKNTEEVVKSFEEIYKKNNEEFSNFGVETRDKLTKENPRKEKETNEEYAERINAILAASKVMNEKFEELDKKVVEEKKKFNMVEVTDKTKEVLKKYILEYGQKEGYVGADDESVEEINEALK